MSEGEERRWKRVNLTLCMMKISTGGDYALTETCTDHCIMVDAEGVVVVNRTYVMSASASLRGITLRLAWPRYSRRRRRGKKGVTWMDASTHTHLQMG